MVAKMNLETIQNNAGSNNGIINNIHGLVEESTSEIRQLSHTLMPASFEQEGLGKIVIEFAHKIINKQIKIDVFEEGDFLSLPKNVAIIAYRIVPRMCAKCTEACQSKNHFHLFNCRQTTLGNKCGR